MTSPAFDADVLVVGLGPVGTALTALLAQQGVRVIAVEKDAQVYPLPRAVHFDHEIMRLFQQLGVAEAVRRHARDLPVYEFRAADGRVLLQLPPARSTPSGWGAGYMFHQPSLDGVLRDLARSLPGADIRTGVRLEGFTQTADGVTAETSGAAGPGSVTARYIVGCDGARSPVRETIGGGLFDYQFDEPWLVIDARVNDDSRVPDVNIQVCDPARPTTCVLSGPGRHRWEFMLLPGETPEAMLDEAVALELIRPWDCGPVEIERMAVYRFHGLVANRWRAGRAFIAGDAAHQTPPFAGQGMCSGLRDASNLAWKLAAVLRGQAAESLLDTYQTEREPHVRAAIELAIGMGRVVCTLDPKAAAERDAGMLAAREAGATPLPPLQPAVFATGFIMPGSAVAGSMLPQPIAGEGEPRLRFDDLLGHDACLITRTAADPIPGLRVLSLDAAPLAPFRAALERWLMKAEAEAVLVRPDRYIFGAGDPGALQTAWAQSLAGAAG